MLNFKYIEPWNIFKNINKFAGERRGKMVEILVKCPDCQVKSLPLAENETSCCIYCPICGRLGVLFFLIKVIKIPAGPEPRKFRQAWLGLMTLAEYKTISPRPGLPQGGYRVPKDITLEVLKQKSKEAADWFKLYYPAEQEYLVFSTDEMEIIEGLGVFENEPANFSLSSFN